MEVGAPVDREELGGAPRELVPAVRLHSLQHAHAHPEPEGQQVGAGKGGPRDRGEAQEEDFQWVGVLGGQAEGGGIPGGRRRTNMMIITIITIKTIITVGKLDTTLIY